MDLKQLYEDAMEFGLTHEQQLVVDTVRDFVEKEFYPLEDDVERTGQVPRALGREINSAAAVWIP